MSRIFTSMHLLSAVTKLQSFAYIICNSQQCISRFHLTIKMPLLNRKSDG
jgi:hypothetical protein